MELQMATATHARRPSKNARRAAILEAAAQVFFEQGYAATSIDAIIKRLGGSKRTIYNEFGSKEGLFTEALKYDPTMFTAKNNLVLARAAQRKYDLPVVDMSQAERAELLYTMALAAIKQGDVSVGKGLLQQAVDTHPQYFDAAARSLAALDANVGN